MMKQGIWSKVSPKLLEISHGVGRVCVRGLAVVAIVATYGFSQGLGIVGQSLGIVGITGLAMTASTTTADAGRRGWGRRGRGWGRRGWGRRGW
jgi:hypothetical protein